MINKLKKKPKSDIILHMKLFDKASSSILKLDDIPENIPKHIYSELKKKDKLIKQLQESLMDKATIPIKETKSSYMNLNLINIKNNKPIILKRTFISCWWCTYPFSNIPCFIPVKYINKTYYVFGCFCSFNCALSYNASLSDCLVAVRRSLLKKLYRDIYDKDCNLHPAPPKELLIKYGGKLTIDEFRSDFIKPKKEFKLILPPMVPMIPIIDSTSEINPRYK